MTERQPVPIDEKIKKSFQTSFAAMDTAMKPIKIGTAVFGVGLSVGMQTLWRRADQYHSAGPLRRMAERDIKKIPSRFVRTVIFEVIGSPSHSAV